MSLAHYILCCILQGMKMQRKVRQNRTSFIKKTLSLIQKYYFVLIVIGCVGFVGIVTFYKMFVTKPTYVYAKIKVGQGYWWATTQQPSVWLVKAIQAAQSQKDLTGKPIAQILRVESYPYLGTSQFNVYVTLKLKVSKVGNKGMYNFNRETIGVATPIDLEFPNAQFSGVIIQISEKPIVTKLVPKVVYLTKKYSYPWEYDAIKIGDKFNDGNEDVIEILDKAKGETNEVLLSDQGKLVSSEMETYNYIVLKIRIMAKEEGPLYVYGEETTLSPIRGFDFVTNGYIFNNFTIAKIE